MGAHSVENIEKKTKMNHLPPFLPPPHVVRVKGSSPPGVCEGMTNTQVAMPTFCPGDASRLCKKAVK